ncbi:ASCC3 [Bugula neritina]|uniref:ASCC3 n=1 Tax=Bugula neritina TaxID=10212 RepID=A0A7J7KDE7_BUGNE|nr:ASCC3 [Bugula neritina]
MLLKRSKGDTKALSQVWPKPKDEGWILAVGHLESKELWALRRVGFVKGQLTASLVIVTPETTGRQIFTLYVMSDSYMALDQQFDLHLDVKDQQTSSK